MRYYIHYGHKDFILCLGYKGEIIRNQFTKFPYGNITFLDTGDGSNKGQRLRMARRYIQSSTFFLAYGDDLADVRLDRLLDFHASHGGVATVTTVNPVCQFGVLKLKGSQVLAFAEKPRLGKWINGGFFVFSRKVFRFLGDGDDLETTVLPRLAEQGLVHAYRHKGFWACMNTHQDTLLLNELWNNNKAKWAVWKNG
jgi:glucose-1-phosphate cytidylyltransferase